MGLENINIEIWGLKKCCFSGSISAEYEIQGNDKVRISTEEGFQFQILHKDIGKIQPLNNIFTAKFFTWLIQQKKQGEPCPFVTDEIITQIQHKRRLPKQNKLALMRL